MKNRRLERIREFEKRLQNVFNNMDIDESKEAVHVMGFRVGGDYDGTSISYVRNLLREHRAFYQTASIILLGEDSNVKGIVWPYTGFVEGGRGMYNPITNEQLLKILDKYNCGEDRGIEKFTDFENEWKWTEKISYRVIKKE